MERAFLIHWPGLNDRVKARLLPEQDPGLLERFWEALPFESIQSHAVVAGFQIYCPFRLLGTPARPWHEPMNTQPVGRVNLELDFQYVALNYGPLTEPVPALPVAQVQEEDLDRLPVIGRAIWDNLLFSNEFLTVKFQPA